MWADLLEAMYRKWSSWRNVPRIPEILETYQGKWHTLFAAFINHHKLSKDEVQKVIDEVRERASASTGGVLTPLPPAPAAASPHSLSMPLPQAAHLLSSSSCPEAEEPSQHEDLNEDLEEEDEKQEMETSTKPKGKKRRGKKRCRPGSTERRWAALERAEKQAQFE